MTGQHKSLRAAIYVKALPGKSAELQADHLRRVCQVRGWTVAGVYRDPPGRLAKLASGKGRLALLDALLVRKRRFDVLLVWKLGMLGHAIDDVLWALAAVHLRRGVHITAVADAVDSTQDDCLRRVVAALDGIGRGGNE